MKSQWVLIFRADLRIPLTDKKINKKPKTKPNEQRALLPQIKEILIDSGKIDPWIDPRCYTHGEVLAAKLKHEQFATIVDSEQFYSLFKRVAQHILAGDLGKPLEYGTSTFSWPIPGVVSIEKISAQVKPSPNQHSKKLKLKMETNTRSSTGVVPSGPKEIRLPTVISQWTDDLGRDRLHVFLQAMSGTEPSEITHAALTSNGSVLQFSVEWPLDVLEAERILSHKRFGSHYNDKHCKRIALSKEIDRITGKNRRIVSLVNTSLPGPNYIFTTDSGHHHFVPILNKDEPNPTIILMFDLTKKQSSEASKFSKRNVSRVEDDLELG